MVVTQDLSNFYKWSSNIKFVSNWQQAIKNNNTLFVTDRVHWTQDSWLAIDHVHTYCNAIVHHFLWKLHLGYFHKNSWHFSQAVIGFPPTNSGRWQEQYMLKVSVGTEVFLLLHNLDGNGAIFLDFRHSTRWHLDNNIQKRCHCHNTGQLHKLLKTVHSHCLPFAPA